MEYKSISTVINTIKGIVKNKENELHYKPNTCELGVILPRQQGTGEYNVLMYHVGLNMMVVRWYDTDINGEVSLYLVPEPDENTKYAFQVDYDDRGVVDDEVEFIPVLTEEEYFQQSTIRDYSKVTLEDMIESVNFMSYVKDLLYAYESELF